MSHFKATKRGIKATFSMAERVFLSDVLPMLAEVGRSVGDPAADRLQVPVYLDNPEANEEWWLLMGTELDDARQADRSVFDRVMKTEAPVTLDVDGANAFLRVLNEARLVLGARMGVEVEEDHDRLPDESRHVLDYLGWVQEELTIELSTFL